MVLPSAGALGAAGGRSEHEHVLQQRLHHRVRPRGAVRLNVEAAHDVHVIAGGDVADHPVRGIERNRDRSLLSVEPC